MTYADKQDIADIYTSSFVDQLVERDEDEGVDAQIDKALAQAASEMNSYLSMRYQTPLTIVPDFIKRGCVDIAVYILSQPHNLLTDEIAERYKRAIAHVKDIGCGKANVPDAATTEDATGAAGDDMVLFGGDDALFTRSTMGDL